MASNLQAIKEHGAYVTTLEGRGYIYMLNNRMFFDRERRFYRNVKK